ncbi:hypothetical protein PoB_002743500 [Plakobranchus ocellatus]|uniref:PH domain-containing protein n=1 Tax=Plakobranchus ocellatus TaxID=259542 RepID=A0AAV4A1Y4_9GAST|nr:hypothetical protein PoB_002743500 [Plakobranchus ocellatus]
MAGNIYNEYGTTDVSFEPDIEGYLVEKFKLMRNVRTWCSLQGPTLYLQKNQGGVMNTVDMATEVQHVRPLSDACQFEIIGKKGKHIFICPSTNECTNWVTALNRAMSLRTNGVGRSFFHASPAPYEEENPYALPSDDENQQNAVASDSEKKANASQQSTYEDVEISPSDTGQMNTDCSETEAPPLPPMTARRQEPVSSFQGTAPSANEEYSDAFSVKTATVSVETDAKGFQNPEAGACSVQFSPEPDVANPEEVITLRSRKSLTPSFVPDIGITEDCSGCTENGPDDDNEDSVDGEIYTDAFTELDLALTCQESPDLELKYQLTADDYQPLEQLRECLANNSCFLEKFSHQRFLLDPEENPIDHIKGFLQQLQL